MSDNLIIAFAIFFPFVGMLLVIKNVCFDTEPKQKSVTSKAAATFFASGLGFNITVLLLSVKAG